MKGFDWEEVKKKLENSVKLDANLENKTIKIIMLDDTLKDDKFVGNLMSNEMQVKQTLGTYINDGKPLNCKVNIDKEKEIIDIHFEDTEKTEEAFRFLKEFFHGDYLKQIIEAMMGAFGGIYGSDFGLEP